MHKNNKIQVEQTKILYQLSPLVLVATLVIVVIVILFFKTSIGQGFLIPWAIWILMLTSARTYLIRSFSKQEVIASPTNWLKMFTVTTFLSGVSWGLYITSGSKSSFRQRDFDFIIYIIGHDGGFIITFIMLFTCLFCVLNPGLGSICY